MQPRIDNAPPTRSEQAENEIIVAILAHANAKTPGERREAWDRLQQLKREQKQDKGHG